MAAANRLLNTALSPVARHSKGLVSRKYFVSHTKIKFGIHGKRPSMLIETCNLNSLHCINHTAYIAADENPQNL